MVNSDLRRNCGIYKLHCNIDGMFYIGSTINDFNTRYITHIARLKRNKHHNISLQDSYNKYGIDNLVLEILEICNDLTTDKIRRLEYKYIQQAYKEDKKHLCNKLKYTSKKHRSKVKKYEALKNKPVFNNLGEVFISTKTAAYKYGCTEISIHKCLAGDQKKTGDVFWGLSEEEAILNWREFQKSIDLENPSVYEIKPEKAKKKRRKVKNSFKKKT